MGAVPARKVITADGNTDFAFDPGKGPITVVIDIDGTITIKAQYGDGLLDSSPAVNFQDSTVITGITASGTYRIMQAVPCIRIVASGTSGGTATVFMSQQGVEYDLDGHFEEADI